MEAVLIRVQTPSVSGLKKCPVNCSKCGIWCQNDIVAGIDVNTTSFLRHVPAGFHLLVRTVYIVWVSELTMCAWGGGNFCIICKRTYPSRRRSFGFCVSGKVWSWAYTNYQDPFLLAFMGLYIKKMCVPRKKTLCVTCNNDWVS